jgi:hypothetical protein
MATLPTLHPTSDEATPWTAWTGTYTNIDDDPSSSASESDVASGPAINSDSTAYYGLTTMPSDFGGMTSLQYRVRYRFQSISNDTLDFYVQIFQSDGTTALTNQMLVASGTANTSWTDSTDVSFTGVVASDKTTWDAARLKIFVDLTKSGGLDAAYVEVAAIDFEGAYTQSAGFSPFFAAHATKVAA